MGDNTFVYIISFILRNGSAIERGGKRVRRISEARAEKCQFIKRVEYQDKIYSLGQGTGSDGSDRSSHYPYKVALTGGNAFVLHRKESDIFFGGIFYSADAYKCSF